MMIDNWESSEVKRERWMTERGIKGKQMESYGKRIEREIDRDR